MNIKTLREFQGLSVQDTSLGDTLHLTETAHLDLLIVQLPNHPSASTPLPEPILTLGDLASPTRISQAYPWF
jgi:hypothetical protein